MLQPIDEVVLLHGYAGNGSNLWFPWLHEIIESRGVRVWSPNLPEPLKPNLERWLKAVSQEAASWTDRTVVIGHSLGGVLALRALESFVRRPVRAVITVSSPFASALSVQTLISFFGQPVDWGKVKRQAEEFVMIQSKNDPIVPYDHVFRYGETLGGKVILTQKDNHFIAKTAPVVLAELERFLPKRLGTARRSVISGR